MPLPNQLKRVYNTNMGSFNRGNQTRGRSFGNKREFDNRSSSRPTLYKTICSKCGKECEVPFRPNGEKPVFCRDCFRENGGADAKRSDERSFSRPPLNQDSGNTQYKEQFIALNAKLDKILDMLTSAIPSNETVAHEAKIIQPEPKSTPEKKKRVSKKAL